MLKDAETHVEDDCQWAPVPCPKCGKQVSKCELSRHETEECPLRGRKCEFAAMGCMSGHLTPNTLRSHLHENIKTHLTLVCRKLKEVDHKLVQEAKQRRCKSITIRALLVLLVVLSLVTIHILYGYLPPTWVATSATEHLEVGWQGKLLKLVQNVEDVTFKERKKEETLMHTVQTLKATHESDVQELQGNLSQITREKEHLLMELQCMRGDLEEYLKQISDAHLTQNGPLDKKATCTLNKKTRDLWYHQQTISRRMSDEPDLVDSTDTVQGIEECSCGSDFIRLTVRILSCLSSIILVEHFMTRLRPKSKPKVMDEHRAKSGSSDTLYAQICQKALYVSSYIGGFLLAFFITCPSYMYTWLFYPATCMNLLSSFVYIRLFLYIDFLSLLLCPPFNCHLSNC